MTRLPLLVALGITGHRQEARLQDTAWVQATISERFRELRQSFSSEMVLEFLMISPLADGADRLFVDAIWSVEPEAKLMVPLPFAQADYENDFNGESLDRFREYLSDPRCLEVLELPQSGDRSYYDVGKFVVDTCDFLFVVHDGVGSGELDGGTASVFEYARFNMNDDLAVSDVRASLYSQSYCEINTSSHQSIMSIADPENFFSNDSESNLILAELDRSYFHNCETPEEFESCLEQLNQSYFDRAAGQSQVRFGKAATLVLLLAFLTGIADLLDLVWPSFLFGELYAEPVRFLNWDGAQLLSLGLVAAILFTMRRKSVLASWLDTRYIAEHLRHSAMFLRLGIPLSSVLFTAATDSARRDLEQVWRSIYLYVYLQFTRLGFEQPGFLESKGLLLERNGLLYDQFVWHSRKASLRARNQQQFHRVRTALLALSIIVVVVAAFSLDEFWGEIWNFAGGVACLLLAFCAAYGESKEHGKIAAEYGHACRRLANIYRGIKFCTNQNRLDELILQSSSTLMHTTNNWMYTMEGKDPDLTA
jgi:hypothetical protein